MFARRYIQPMITGAHPVSNIRLHNTPSTKHIQQFHHEFWLQNNLEYTQQKAKTTLDEDEFNRTWLIENRPRFLAYNRQVWVLSFTELFLAARDLVKF